MGKLVDQIKNIIWVWFLGKLQAIFWSNPCNARVSCTGYIRCTG